ncbi:MAG: hypothetical protein GWP14_05315 [Actinobacteria bacterium]|nr:hypothetical protein [Actinomycetota bacterium]
MAIEFQCEHCEKTIRTADELGGRMGKCPHCGHSMYIPLPASEKSEVLELEQVDPEEEAQREQLMARTRQTLHDLLQDRAETEAKENQATDYKETVKGKGKPIDPEDAAMTVEEYVVAMARGSLEEADALAVHLVGNPQVVNPVIAEAMERGFDHPSLRDVPEAVQKGFLRKLAEYLNG